MEEQSKGDLIAAEDSSVNDADQYEELDAIEPDMMVHGKPRYNLDTAASKALVIHCGDPRFQTAFRRFVTEELEIKQYTPIIIGGGIHAFGMQTFLPKNFKILWEQIKFYLKLGKLNQVIIINHEDCSWYDKMKGYHSQIEVTLKGKHDLKRAAFTILRDFSGISVRSFWAGLENNQVYFTEVV